MRPQRAFQPACLDCLEERLALSHVHAAAARAAHQSALIAFERNANDFRFTSPQDDHIDKASNRLSVALVVLGGLIGSSIIGVFAKSGPHVIGLNLLSFVGFVLSGVFGIWLIWGIARHGRL